MTYEYEIYQTETRKYCFMPFEFAMKHDFCAVDYDFCIKGKVEASCVNEALEKLWVKYNADDRPMALQMRSLSMSDVVVLNGKPYYCNRFGWSEIPPERWQR